MDVATGIELRSPGTNERCQYLELNRWEALAALQALSIYILIRVDEGETEHNNLDFLLLSAVTVRPGSTSFLLD